MGKELTARNPAPNLSIDRETIQSLPPSVQTCLRAKMRFEPFRVVGHTFEGIAPRQDIERALAIVTASMQAADHNFILKELGRLFYATRGSTSDDLAPRIAIFAEELADFPADAVQTGCREWCRQNIWRPSLHELVEACERHCFKRREIKLTLERALWKATPIPYQAGRLTSDSQGSDE